MHLPPPSLAAIRQRVIKLRNAPPTDAFWGAYFIAMPLLLHYMGTEWWDRHVEPVSKVGGYLKTGPQNLADEEVHMIRLIELAELLFNCHGVPGFPDMVRRAAAESQVESVVAELRVARLLLGSWVKFRFVVPIAERGADYDLEITLADGLIAPTETKAKVEGRTLSERTVINSLEDARRRNLPPNRPGIIFLHVTQEWMVGTSGLADGRDLEAVTQHTRAMYDTLNAAIEKFLRNTQRVLAVVTVTAPIVEFG